MSERRTTTIYLLRHGATVANGEVPYRLQGRALDLPLAPEGLDQARRAGAALRVEPIVAVYSGPLLRARATAAEVAAPFGLSPRVDPGLTEADLGRWDGLTWDQARAQDPEHHAAFFEHPGTVPYPGGESFEAAGRRMLAAVGAIAGAHPGGAVAVVGHNVTNRAYLALVLGLPIDRARTIRQANGGISVVAYEAGGPVVQTINARFHLDPRPAPGPADGPPG